MKNYWLYYILAIICLILAFIAPAFLTWKQYNEFGPTTGFIGDTIGGLTAPFLSIAGSILVFAALRAQIDANKAVQDQFVHQQKENEKRDLEQKLFRLFDLHLTIIKDYKTDYETVFYDYQKRIIEPKYAGIEFGFKMSELLKRKPLLESYSLIDTTMNIFEWTMFDGADYWLKDGASSDEILDDTLYHYFESMKGLFYRYYNNCFFILTTVDSSQVHDEKQKRDLVNMYLNILTYNELKWLFWMSFHEEYKIHQPLLEKYKCFNRINYYDFGLKSYMDFPDRFEHVRKG